MSKVRLNVTIDIQGEEFNSYNSHSIDVKDPGKLSLDILLQTFCAAIPKHDFPKTDKLGVLQCFDTDGQIIGHGEF